MQIDLTADLGEGGAFDRELLSLVSSANISCGAHAGNEATISRAIELALEHKVRIGAHPSYPDRDNFGRLPLQLSFASLRDHLLSQLDSLQTIAAKHMAVLSHIKPHGALYNQLAKDIRLAEHVTAIVKEFNPQLTVVGMAGGYFLQVAKHEGLSTLSEVFADRRYQSDGSLVPRDKSNAMIVDSDEAVAQSLQLVCQKQVRSVDGQLVPVQADTLCIHGDSSMALIFAQKLHQRFTQEGISIAALIKAH